MEDKEEIFDDQSAVYGEIGEEKDELSKNGNQTVWKPGTPPTKPVETKETYYVPTTHDAG